MAKVKSSELRLQEVVERDFPKTNTYIRFSELNSKDNSKDSLKDIISESISKNNSKNNSKKKVFLVTYGKRELKKLQEQFPQVEGIVKLYDQMYQKDFIKEQFKLYLGRKYNLKMAFQIMNDLQPLKANSKFLFISEIPTDFIKEENKTNSSDTFSTSKLYTTPLEEDIKEEVKENKESKETIKDTVEDKQSKECKDLVPNTIYELTVEDFVTESIKGVIFEDIFGNELYYDKTEVNPFIYSNTPIMYWGIFDGETPYKFIRYKTESEKEVIKKYKVYKGSSSFIIDTNNITKVLKELKATRYDEIK